MFHNQKKKMFIISILWIHLTNLLIVILASLDNIKHYIISNVGVEKPKLIKNSSIVIPK